MYYGYRCYDQDGQPIGWLYTCYSDTELAFTNTNLSWCKRWKTERGAAKNFDHYNGRWQSQSKGGYLKVEVMPEVTQTEVSKQQKTEQKDNIYKMNNQTKETKFGYFQRQTMIEKLTRRFAKLNGYEIEPDLQVLEADHPRIKVWIAMAEVAIDEVEQEILSINE